MLLTLIEQDAPDWARREALRWLKEDAWPASALSHPTPHKTGCNSPVLDIK
jgi:hypothetical protein